MKQINRGPAHNRILYSAKVFKLPWGGTEVESNENSDQCVAAMEKELTN